MRRLIGNASRPFAALAMGLFLSVALLGCAGIESSVAVLTFQKHPASGITQDQNFLVYLLRPGRELAIPAAVRNHADPYFQMELTTCTRPPAPAKTRGSRFHIPIAAAVIARSGQVLLDSAYSEVEARAKRLEALSQKTYSARVSWTTTPSTRWDEITCVLVVRLTGTGSNAQNGLDELGMLVLMRREERGRDGSIITPSYAVLNNAVAVTGNASPGSLQLNLALSVDWLANSNIRSTGQIALPQINIPLGQPLRLCEVSQFADRSRCPNASGLFVDPPINASAIQVSISATETGSSANIAQHVGAGNEAIRAIARPLREAALRRLVDELSGDTPHR